LVAIFPFDFKYRPFCAAWKAASCRFTESVKTSNFNGEISAAWTNKYSRFSVWFPGQKIVKREKVARMRAITAFFEAGHAGSREMVFDLLVDAKPSPSW